MSDSNMRAALRSLTEEDLPFLVDLLERISGKKWRVAPDTTPSLEHILTHTFFLSVGNTLTGHYGKRAASAPNIPGAERRIAMRLREML